MHVFKYSHTILKCDIWFLTFSQASSDDLFAYYTEMHITEWKVYGSEDEATFVQRNILIYKGASFLHITGKLLHFFFFLVPSAFRMFENEQN